MNNQSFLIKTKDIKSNRMEIMEYKSNYNWNKSIFYIDYLKTLSKAKKIDNWWSYWG
ncbi:hypothetical protein D3C78_1032030 [compost metagenome]